MWNMTMPVRATRLFRQNVQHQPLFQPNAGLNLRLNVRSYIRPSETIKLSQKSPQEIQRSKRSLILLGGVGLALYSTSYKPSKTLRSDFDPSQSNQASFSSTRGYSIGQDGDPNNELPFGDDGTDYPKSQINVYNLGFGSICGICAGIFIKKGLKFVAFLLGGGFILLQYLNSQKLIKVDWKALSSRYDSAIDRAAGGKDAVQIKKPSSGWKDSTAARIWNRFTHFLTADFPSRGTFLAGLVLGLRLG